MVRPRAFRYSPNIDELSGRGSQEELQSRWPDHTELKSREARNSLHNGCWSKGYRTVQIPYGLTEYSKSYWAQSLNVLASVNAWV
jgi:hypothetical protein